MMRLVLQRSSAIVTLNELADETWLEAMNDYEFMLTETMAMKQVGEHDYDIEHFEEDNEPEEPVPSRKDNF
jgi:hypothetical protein